MVIIKLLLIQKKISLEIITLLLCLTKVLKRFLSWYWIFNFRSSWFLFTIFSTRIFSWPSRLITLKLWSIHSLIILSWRDIFYYAMKESMRSKILALKYNYWKIDRKLDIPFAIFLTFISVVLILGFIDVPSMSCDNRYGKYFIIFIINYGKGFIG